MLTVLFRHTCQCRMPLRIHAEPALWLEQLFWGLLQNKAQEGEEAARAYREV